MNKYEDIINLPHYEPIYHSRMSIDKRRGRVGFAEIIKPMVFGNWIERHNNLLVRRSASQTQVQLFYNILRNLESLFNKDSANIIERKKFSFFIQTGKDDFTTIWKLYVEVGFSDFYIWRQLPIGKNVLEKRKTSIADSRSGAAAHKNFYRFAASPDNQLLRYEVGFRGACGLRTHITFPTMGIICQQRKEFRHKHFFVKIENYIGHLHHHLLPQKRKPFILLLHRRYLL